MRIHKKIFLNMLPVSHSSDGVTFSIWPPLPSLTRQFPFIHLQTSFHIPECFRGLVKRKIQRYVHMLRLAGMPPNYSLHFRLQPTGHGSFIETLGTYMLTPSSNIHFVTLYVIFSKHSVSSLRSTLSFSWFIGFDRCFFHTF